MKTPFKSGRETLSPNEIFNFVYAIERLRLNQLKLPEKLLRIYSRHDRRRAARLIEQFGFLTPLLVDENNVIVGGVFYYLGAQILELTDVPVVRITHLSNEQIQTYRIAEQRLPELAPWDKKALAEEFKFLAALDLNFDLEITGFSTAEIDLHIAGLEDPRPPNVDNELPSPQTRAVTVSGDKWNLDRHRLICGSSLDRVIWNTLLEGELAALLFTDPPYNVRIEGHVSGNGKIAHREFGMASGEMTTEEYRGFLKSVLGNAHDHTMDGSLHYICIDWRHIDDVLAVGRNIFAKLVNICCWVKNNGGMGSFYRSRHELVPVFRKGLKAHRNNIELGRHGRNRTNVWEYAGATTFAGRSSDEGNTLAMHPTAKPVAMIADAIMDSTTRNALLVDPFLGSGATLMAAERVGRRLYGIELDPLYVDVAIRRWQQQTGQDAVHAETGKSFNDIEANGDRNND